MKISIVGTGYVGLVTGTCFANSGNHVTCLDVDPARIDLLEQGGCPIYEPGLTEMIARNFSAERLIFTTDKQQAYQSAEIIFICVGTPSADDGQADLSYIIQAATDLGTALEAAPGPTGGDESSTQEKIVVVKSTVPVGTNQKVKEAIQAQTSKPFFMASNPEFLKEGAAIDDFCKPDRVVIGTDNEQAAKRMEILYQPFVRQGNPIYIMDIPSAEMVKYASNAMLATKISFINEMALLCESYGADIDSIRLGMCSDRRIGNQFFYPGLGYGGSCFPKDVQACVHMGQDSGHGAELLAAVHNVNQRQRDLFIDKIKSHFGENLSDKQFAIWGLAFKPGTDDMRQAPSLDIIESLLHAGATVTGFDPVATDAAKQILGDKIQYANRDLDALQNADALIICTDCNQFKQPDFTRMSNMMKNQVIFDGRNLYPIKQMQQLNFTYYSIGRATVVPPS